MPPHRVVPVPVALDRFTREPRPLGDEIRFLHVVGRQAWGDRAGTGTLLRALRHCQQPIHLTMVTQDHRLPVTRTSRRNVRISLIVRSRVPYWELYSRADVLLAPRRYGGLSLVHNEAAAAGLALVLPDTCPHPETWPGVHLPAREHRLILNSGHGPIPVHDVDTVELAHTIDELGKDAARVRELSDRSRRWAEEHSWERLAPLYRQELELAAAAPMRA